MIRTIDQLRARIAQVDSYLCEIEDSLLINQEAKIPSLNRACLLRNAARQARRELEGLELAESYLIDCAA